MLHSLIQLLVRTAMKTPGRLVPQQGCHRGIAGDFFNRHGINAAFMTQGVENGQVDQIHIFRFLFRVYTNTVVYHIVTTPFLSVIGYKEEFHASLPGGFFGGLEKGRVIFVDWAHKAASLTLS